MRFSIIVPIFNTERFVVDCIQSVLNQTYDDYELILVDDGSTDNSGLICDEFAQTYAQIKVFHKENSGQIDSRNKGLKEATGEYIVFLDADDLLDVNALKTIHDKICEYHCDMVIYSYNSFYDSLDAIKRNKDEDIFISDIKMLSKVILANDPKYNAIWRKAINIKCLKNLGPSIYSHVRYGEDLLQTLDFLSQNPKTVIIDDVLYYYRLNPVSITRSLQIDKYVVDTIIVRDAVYQWLNKYSIFDANEMYDYKAVATKILADVIVHIASDKSPISKKKKLLTFVNRSDYYKFFIAYGKTNMSQLGNKKIIWYLYQKGAYHLLIRLINIRSLLLGR